VIQEPWVGVMLMWGKLLVALKLKKFFKFGYCSPISYGSFFKLEFFLGCILRLKTNPISLNGKITNKSAFWDINWMPSLTKKNN